VDAAGRVLGDSDLSPEEILNVENHGARPEILEAGSRGVGVTHRFSTTLGKQMLYLARPYHVAGQDGFVRAALPMDDVHALESRLFAFLGVSGLVALLIAALMSGLASHLLTRTFRSLVTAARQTAEGGAARLAVRGSDEFGGLAGRSTAWPRISSERSPK